MNKITKLIAKLCFEKCIKKSNSCIKLKQIVYASDTFKNMPNINVLIKIATLIFYIIINSNY